jgi:uncharacterized protein (DUF4415 family)
MRENEKHITRVTRDEAHLLKDETDYARLDAMTDADIAKAVAADPNAVPLDIDWTKARLVIPPGKDIITLRLDRDVLDYLRAQGKGYQTLINQILRTWFDAHAQINRERTALAAREAAKKTADMLKLKTEPGAKEREASVKKAVKEAHRGLSRTALELEKALRKAKKTTPKRHAAKARA